MSVASLQLPPGTALDSDQILGLRATTKLTLDAEMTEARFRSPMT